MGVGVCVTAPNNNNKVIKVNQLEDKENVIDNFNYEEYAVDKDFGDGNNLDNNISNNNDIIENKQSSERKKVKNVFKDETENENSKKLEETKKEEEKKMEETKKEEEKKVEETKKEEEKKIEETKKEEEKKIEEIKKDENITKEKNQKNNLEVNQNEFVGKYESSNKAMEDEDINENYNENNEEKVPKLKAAPKKLNNNNKSEEEKLINKNVPKIPLQNIFNIINEKTIIESNSNDPIFFSDLLKMSNFNIKEKVKYYDSFCVMTKIAFLIYHSKENYINLKKPLAEIPINYFKSVALFKINKRLSGYDHFLNSFEKNNKINEILKKLYLFYFNENIELDEEKKQDEILMLMFKSTNKDLIKKWYVLLNYFKNANFQVEEQK